MTEEKEIIKIANELGLLDESIMSIQHEELVRKYSELSFIIDNNDSFKNASNEIAEVLLLLTIFANRFNTTLNECLKLSLKKINGNIA